MQRKVEISLAGFTDEIVDGVKRVPHERVTDQIVELIRDVMVSREAVKKIVQTVHDEPDTWSPEAQNGRE